MSENKCETWKSLDRRFATDPRSPLHHDNRCTHCAVSASE